jgi:hypothetical protein
MSKVSKKATSKSSSNGNGNDVKLSTKAASKKDIGTAAAAAAPTPSTSSNDKKAATKASTGKSTAAATPVAAASSSSTKRVVKAKVVESDETTKLNEFMAKYGKEIEKKDNGKVRCLVTGHDIPWKLTDLEAHWNGRVYRREKKKWSLTNEFDIKKYAPWIIPSKRDLTKVFCKLTKMFLNKNDEELEKHMKGRYGSPLIPFTFTFTFL